MAWPCTAMCVSVCFSMSCVAGGCHGRVPRCCVFVCTGCRYMGVWRAEHHECLVCVGCSGVWVSLCQYILCVCVVLVVFVWLQIGIALGVMSGCDCVREYCGSFECNACACVGTIFGWPCGPGTLPALLSAGVCHTMCVVSGCGCRFQFVGSCESP